MERKQEFCNLCNGYTSDGSDHAVRKSVKPRATSGGTGSHGWHRPTQADDCADCDGVNCPCEENCDCSDWSSATESDAEHENVEEAPEGGDLENIDNGGQAPPADSDVEPEDETATGAHETDEIDEFDKNFTFVVRGKRAVTHPRKVESDSDFEDVDTNKKEEDTTPKPKSLSPNVTQRSEEATEEDSTPSGMSLRDRVRMGALIRHRQDRNKHDSEDDKNDDDNDNSINKSEDAHKTPKQGRTNKNDSDLEDAEESDEDNKYSKRHTNYFRRGHGDKEKREVSNESDNEEKMPNAIEEFIERKSASTVEGFRSRGQRWPWRGNRPQARKFTRKRRHLYSNVRMPTGKKFWVSIPAAEKSNWKCNDKTKLINLRPHGKMGRREFTIVAKEMEKTRRSHSSGKFTGYKILKIQKIVNPCLWKKYRHRRRDIMRESKANERMLFHGSPAYKDLINKGFDERYASKAGMFGAGLYFAQNSSKSNQYVFGLNGPCTPHKSKHCLVCERVLILCRVTLGKVQTYTKENQRAHPPVGCHSVEGTPSAGGLQYSENIIYRGEQVYPEFLITYKLKP